MISIKFWFSRVFRMKKMVTLTRNGFMVNSFSPVLHLILKPVTCFAFLVNATILFILKTRENQNFTEITLRHKIYPVNMLHLIRTPFLKNKSVRLLLNMCYLVYYHQKLPFGVIFRSSRPEVFCKKGVLRNFSKFTGKHLCQNLSTLLKKRLCTGVSPWIMQNF